MFMKKNLNLLKIIRRYLPVVVANTSVVVFASDVVIVAIESVEEVEEVDLVECTSVPETTFLNQENIQSLLFCIILM